MPSEKSSMDSKLSVEENDEIETGGSSIPFYSKKERLAKTTKPYSHYTTLQSSSRGRERLPPSSGSVNQALNAARRAREKVLKERAQAAKSIRGQWKEEKEEALEFYSETEKLRREQLNLQNQLSSNFSRSKAQQNHSRRQAQREESAKEAIFKSDVAREQREKLKEQEDRRRRESTAIRAKIRANNREGSEKLRLIKIEEEKAVIEERHSASQAFQQYQRDRQDSARKNYQFKQGDAIRIRQLHEAMEQRKKEESHESFEMKLAAARDVDEHRKELAQKRRQSLESRNEFAREQRQRDEDHRTKQHQAEHESYELKRAAEKDVEVYKQGLQEERRASLAFRGEAAQKHREVLSTQHDQQKKADQESYKIKFEADKDVEACKQREALLRRQSLEQRGAMAREVRTKQLNDEGARQELEHESWELKFAGQKDVEDYVKAMDAKRRQSLKDRNGEAKLQRDEEDKRRRQAAMSEHESYELKWDGERDAQEYLRKVDQERRESLKSRNLAALKQRNQADTQKTADLHAQHESFELTRAANKDVDEYRKKVEQDRRDSLAFRNQEKARHVKVMEELEGIAKEKEAESYLLKWGGENDVKEYQAQLEEERRNSIRFRNEEARRHRQADDEMHYRALAEKHQDEELKAAGKSDPYYCLFVHCL